MFDCLCRLSGHLLGIGGSGRQFAGGGKLIRKFAAGRGEIAARTATTGGSSASNKQEENM